MDNSTCQYSDIPRGVRRVLGAAALLIGLWNPVRSDDHITVLPLAADPGETGRSLLVAASNSEPIHGYSVALSYPTDVLHVRQFDLEGTHVAAFEPEFVAQKIDQETGHASLAVILNYVPPMDQPRAIPALPDLAPPRIIGRMVVDVLETARGGEHPLVLTDGLGLPSAYNRFTTAGVNRAPRLDDGFVYVRGKNWLKLESHRAFAGIDSPNVTFFLFAQHDEKLAGYSAAVAYPGQHMELLDADLVQTATQAVIGNRVEFFRTDVDDSRADQVFTSQTAVVFEYPEIFQQLDCPSPVLDPVDDLTSNSIMRYRFRVNRSASANDAYQTLSLTDTGGSTALTSSFLFDRCPHAPDSRVPETIDGRVYFSTGGFRGRVTDALTGLPVSGATVRTEPEQFEALTAADGTFEIRDVIPGRYWFAVNRSGYYEGVFPQREARGFDDLDETGALAIYTIPQPPKIEDGADFRRGDGNADGFLDLSDGIFILSYLFLGGANPQCFDSIDTDDSGSVNITDGVAIFAFLFLGGETPPLPGAFDCGPDPSLDPLSCVIYDRCQ